MTRQSVSEGNGKNERSLPLQVALYQLKIQVEMARNLDRLQWLISCFAGFISVDHRTWRPAVQKLLRKKLSELDFEAQK